MTLSREGLKVALNEPFKEAEIFKRYGHPSHNRHSLQIETNRTLYINERRLQIGDEFEGVKAVMDRPVAALADFCRSRI